jgi:hypothetical protein
MNLTWVGGWIFESYLGIRLASQVVRLAMYGILGLVGGGRGSLTLLRGAELGNERAELAKSLCGHFLQPFEQLWKASRIFF